MSKKKSKYIVIPGDGDPCPRCRQPMQIREHAAITAKHLAQPYYFKRWHHCMNLACQTKQVNIAKLPELLRNHYSCYHRRSLPSI